MNPGRFATILALTVPLGVVTATQHAAATWRDVAVSVVETTGAGRHEWPMVVNVPFAPGTVQPGDELVLRHRGRDLPTQTSVLGRWRDGSVRWLRLDALVALRSGQRARMEITRAPSPKPRQVLRIVDNGDAVAIDTGVLRFEVPRARLALADRLRLAAAADSQVGAVSVSMVADGSVVGAAPPSSVTVVERGPVRGVIEVKGPLGDAFEQVMRIEVHAGSPALRVLHTYTKTGGRILSKVERLSVDLPFAQRREGAFACGVERGKPLRGTSSDRGVVLSQPDNQVFEVDGERRKGRLAGWCEVAGGPTVGLAGRWFWQEYPKAMSLGTHGLTYDLWSPRGGVARIGIGSAKTHEFVLWLGSDGAIDSGRGAAWRKPLRGVVDPSYVFATGALRGAVDPGRSYFDEDLLRAAVAYRKRNAKSRWDDCGLARCGEKVAEVPRVGAFGMLNWGDWNYPGYRDDVKGTDAWGNLEYDTTQVLALTSAATADAAVFDLMVAAARHYMDVDTIHAMPVRPEWVGMNHPKNPRHFSLELGGVDLGHTWAEGLVSYYWLTGDARGLRVARGIADYLVRRRSDVSRGNPRQWGWPQVALLAVFDATGEQRYLDAAQSYARAGMAAHVPRGKLGWKLGVLADALAATHSYTGDEAIRLWLSAYAERVVGENLEDARFMPALAYAGVLSGNEKWIGRALARVGALSVGKWGKPFTLNGRTGLRVYSIVHSRRRGKAPPAATTSPPR